MRSAAPGERDLGRLPVVEPVEDGVAHREAQHHHRDELVEGDVLRQRDVPVAHASP